MAAKIVPELSPDQVRKTMLRNTAVVEAYAQQIKAQLGELLSLINEFQEGATNNGDQ